MTIGITLAAGIIADRKGATEDSPKVLLVDSWVLIVSLLLGHSSHLLANYPLIGDRTTSRLHGCPRRSVSVLVLGRVRCRVDPGTI